MKNLYHYLFILIFFLSFQLSAQQPHLLKLKNTTLTFEDNVAEYVKKAVIEANEVIDGNYYRLIRFNEIPNQDLLDKMEEQGIKLLEYLSDKTYVASFPSLFNPDLLPAYQIRSIQNIKSDFKIDTRVQKEVAARSIGNIELMLRYHHDLVQEDVRALCEFDKINLLAYNDYNSVMKISVPKYRIAELAELPYIAYLDLTPGIDIPDDTGGRSLHRANAIDTDYATGRHYNGEGVSVLTRDDGAIGAHIDYQGRLNQDFVGPSRGTHGDGVSGIFAGAGNLDPSQKGMANGAFLYVLDYDASFLDQTMNLFFNRDVLVTNSSYSNGCNAGYTSTTITVEQQLFENQTLMHVFSAGNSNNLDCDYGAGDQWGNITGGHKQAKNCITTANLFVDAELVNSSSRGPAHDGRIKPDISAHGAGQGSTAPDNDYLSFGGTSAAAPGIAGVTAMLHQAYRELNNGEIASAPLLKACLLNTANELGNKGPDFRFGWGQVNALRATQTLEDQRWLKATANQGQTNTHTIEIPDGVIEARMMTYWADRPGSEQTVRALVNDINTTVDGPNGTEYLPWVLDPTPNPTTLNLPATKGTDNLNNMEQVAIDNPAPGTYTLNVTGDVLPFGNHDYYVVWEFRTADITVTYPIGGERLTPGNTEWIRWDAEDMGSSYTLSYSVDGGGSWSLITNVSSETSLVDWTVPNELTGEALIRISRGGVEGISDTTFSIARQPNNLEITAVCLDYVDLEWQAVSGAESYTIYKLGGKYMEEIATSTDDSVRVVVGNTSVDLWFAVDAVYPNGARSERTFAIGHSGGIVNCLLTDNFVVDSIKNPSNAFEISCKNFDEAIEVVIVNRGLDPETNIEVGYELETQGVVIEMITDTIQSNESYTYTFNQQPSIALSGEYDLTTWTEFDDDIYPFDDTISTRLTVYTENGVPLDFSEDFESLNFPRDFWQLENDDDDISWTTFNVVGSDGQFTSAAFMAFRQYTDNRGAIDRLSTIPLDFTSATDSLYLIFDVAHTRTNADEDGLIIDVSTDCGETFSTVIYEKFGNDLETENFVSGTFFPTLADQWRIEAIDISQFIGMDGVIIRFNAINDTGNSLFIDNINIRKPNFQPPVADFSVSSDQACLGSQSVIQFVNQSQGELNSYQWRFGLGASPASATGIGPHFVSYFVPRPTEATLIVTNPAGIDTFIMPIDVVRPPTASITSEVVGEARVNFTSAVNTTVEYLWEFGDGQTSEDPNPSHVFPGPGDYNVTLNVANACGGFSISETVTVLGTGIFDPEDLTSVRLLPNPNSGIFDLILVSGEFQDVKVHLLDVRGRQIVTHNMNIGVGENLLRFNEENLASGIYILQIQGNNQSRSMKVVIE